MEPVDIYNTIRNNDSGKEIPANKPWTEVENKLYKYFQSVITRWLESRIITALIETTTPRSDVITNLNLTRLPLPSRTKIIEKLNDHGQPTDIPTFSISNFNHYIKTIREIGKKPETNSHAYLLRNPNSNTTVLLDPKNIYAYPLTVNGAAADLSNYQVQYGGLLSQAAKSAKHSDVSNFLNLGLIPPIADRSKKSILVAGLVANYISEVVRNWLQLYILLVELGGYQRTSFQLANSSPNVRFPMASGGAWKNQFSWGGMEINPNASVALTPGVISQLRRSNAIIKRWLLQVFVFDTLFDVAGQPTLHIQVPQDPRLEAAHWISFIARLQSMPNDLFPVGVTIRGFFSNDAFDRHIPTLLNSAIQRIAQV